MARSKKEASERHLQRRFGERFGIRLSKEGMKKIVLSIQNGTATFVKRSSNRVTVWDVPCRVVVPVGEIYDKDETFRVAYDTERKIPVTVFPGKQIQEV